jgi:hypothetical protein
LFELIVEIPVDFTEAITRNSEALKVIVTALFAMLGLSGEVTVSRIPRPLHSAVLRVLRPAESALRRLIVIAARGLVVKARALRPMSAGPFIGRRKHARVAFQLFDPRKTFARPQRRATVKIVPRIHVFGGNSWMADRREAPAPDPAPPRDGLVDAGHLARRLEALKMALDDLPRQAKRLARWRAKRETAKAAKFTSPLRPGHPPGYRSRRVHDIDRVLAECHGLAFDALMPDTS